MCALVVSPLGSPALRSPSRPCVEIPLHRERKLFQTSGVAQDRTAGARAVASSAALPPSPSPRERPLRCREGASLTSGGEKCQLHWWWPRTRRRQRRRQQRQPQRRVGRAPLGMPAPAATLGALLPLVAGHAGWSEGWCIRGPRGCFTRAQGHERQRVRNEERRRRGIKAGKARG